MRIRNTGFMNKSVLTSLNRSNHDFTTTKGSHYLPVPVPVPTYKYRYEVRKVIRVIGTNDTIAKSKSLKNNSYHDLHIWKAVIWIRPDPTLVDLKLDTPPNFENVLQKSIKMWANSSWLNLLKPNTQENFTNFKISTHWCLYINQKWLFFNISSLQKDPDQGSVSELNYFHLANPDPNL